MSLDIHEAALAGDVAGVAAFIESGVDVNDLDIEMRTPLHCAVEAGSAECIKALVACKSIDLEVRDLVGATPLFVAGTFLTKSSFKNRTKSVFVILFEVFQYHLPSFFFV
jgi:ankyrin repeat protein